MKYTIAAAFGAIVLGAAIASCGNNGNLATAASTPTPNPTPSTPCTSPPNTQVQVVYPQPNASGVTTAIVIVAVAPSPLPATSNLYVSVTDTSLQQLLGYAYGTTLSVIPSSEVPNSALTPPFAFPIYEQSSFGGLFGTGDTFRVFLANTMCYPGVNLQSSFST